MNRAINRNREDVHRGEVERPVPFCSIILPVHNGAQSLERAVRSVQAQTVADWELLAVDDASTDGTRELLERLAAEDARLRILSTGENVGECAARGTGKGVGSLFH